eukprot:TRINITY_DN3220_c0_g1_i10.p1 TRINITY_DN3220_c0_g1~~TRINITY_DN3220_c0_g1_i10.p1  ORF type:complete len:140 (+),score=13.83 TRINITY_DN3220_c0_g1_i10:392-811(+)
MSPHGAYISQVEYSTRIGRWHIMSLVSPPKVAVNIPQSAHPYKLTPLRSPVWAPVAANTPSPTASVQKSHSSSVVKFHRRTSSGHKKKSSTEPVSYTHLRAHETPEHLVCRLLLEKKKKKIVIPYSSINKKTVRIYKND